MPLSSPYSPSALREALTSLHAGCVSDLAHLREGGDYGASELSALQIITATRIIDYEKASKSPEYVDVMTLKERAEACSAGRLNLAEVVRRRAPVMCMAAEFKRASPSKGPMGMHLDPAKQTVSYWRGGADVISVLTEKRWFKGGLEDLEAVLGATTEAAAAGDGPSRPAVLRKDFIVSEYQVYESAAAGADTLLLIVAVTPRPLLLRLIGACRSVGIEPLVEIHAAEELDVALECGATVIGVNNRNLHTFELDLGTTDRAAATLGNRGIKFHHGEEGATHSICALSGMSDAHDVHRYRNAGVGMVLVGESLMRAACPTAAIKKLCLDPTNYDEMVGEEKFVPGLKLVKVCGITTPEDALIACRVGANLIGVIFAPKSKRAVTVEQATAVVRAVRAFGERKTAADVSVSSAAPEENPVAAVARSSRSLERAARLRPLVVGVFQNASQEDIRQAVDGAGLDLVQLHGDEGMEACAGCGVPALRVVHITADAGGDAETRAQKIVDSLTADPTAILLDTAVKGVQGGTGVTFDWGVATALQEKHGLPVIVAGGLKPDNVAEAVGRVRPWGVDVSSGVETSPRVKDPEKVGAFVFGARAAATGMQ